MTLLHAFLLLRKDSLVRDSWCSGGARASPNEAWLLPWRSGLREEWEQGLSSLWIGRALFH